MIVRGGKVPRFRPRCTRPDIWPGACARESARILSNSSSGPRCFDVRPCLNQRAFFSLDRRFVNKESDEPFSGIVTVPTLDKAEQMSRVELTSISKNNSASTIRAPTASLKGLRVYMAEGDALRPKFRRYRRKNTGRGIAEWLVGMARRGRAHAGRHRPRLLVSAALFRGARPDARLTHLP